MFQEVEGAYYRAQMNPDFVLAARLKAERRRADMETEADARRLMKSYGAPSWVADIVVETAIGHGASPLAVAGRARDQKSVRARNAAIYQVKATKPNLSSPQIARWFGRNHTGILFALASHQEQTGAPMLTGYRTNRERRRAATAAYARRKAMQ
ncbi:MAG: hypothetical protein WBA88_15965 [Pseudaminobacter sp.]